MGLSRNPNRLIAPVNPRTHHKVGAIEISRLVYKSLVFARFIQDRNDVAPVYSSLPRPVRLRSTVPIGQVVTTVIAVDSDGTAPNNQVNYKSKFDLHDDYLSYF
jgi:hypothetical protein